MFRFFYVFNVKRQLNWALSRFQLNQSERRAMLREKCVVQKSVLGEIEVERLKRNWSFHRSDSILSPHAPDFVDKCLRFMSRIVAKLKRRSDTMYSSTSKSMVMSVRIGLLDWKCLFRVMSLLLTNTWRLLPLVESICETLVKRLRNYVQSELYCL